MQMESWCAKSKFPKDRQLEVSDSSFCPRDSYTVKKTLPQQDLHQTVSWAWGLLHSFFVFCGLHIGLYFVKYLWCSRVFLLLEKTARQILQLLLQNRSLYVCEWRNWIGSVRANESSLVKGDSWIGNSLNSKHYKIARLFMRSLLRPVPPLQESCIKNGTIMINYSFLMVA